MTTAESAPPRRSRYTIQWNVGMVQRNAGAGARRAGEVLLLLLVAVLRFVHLGADFPLGLTRSGALYTDEGWYAAGAINAALRGHWYLPGDFNAAISMPAGQLLTAASFRLFGFGLIAARLGVALCSLVLLVTAWLLCRAYCRRAWAPALAVLLLGIDFPLFAHARVALMEVPTTAATLLAMAILLLPRQPRLGMAAVAGGLLGIAVLTKATAAAALPALLYLAWVRAPEERRQKWLLPALAGGVFALIAGGYHLWASHYFAADYAYFRHINVAERAVHSPIGYLHSLRTTILGFYHLEHTTVLAVPVMVGLAVAVVRRRLLANPMIVVAALWLVGSVLMMGLISYHPTRYSVPLLVPAYLLLVGGADTIATAPEEEREGANKQPARAGALLRFGPALGALLLALPNAAAVTDYLSRPAYTFTSMAADVGRIVRAEGYAPGTIPLMGGPAYSIALGAEVPAMNSDLGTSDLAWRVARYRPRFYITDGVDPQADIVAHHYRPVKVGAWNVYGNYYTGRPLTLYRLDYSTAVTTTPHGAPVGRRFVGR